MGNLNKKRGVIMYYFAKHSFLFVLGGSVYYGLELLFRNYSHGSMFLLGGLCFWLCGRIGKLFEGEIPFIWQMLLCAITITTLELIVGYLVNIKWQLQIWDYSQMPGNIYGQICIPFTVIWCFLGGIAIIIDRWIENTFYI